jgi:hydrogenase expression/formation protein HypC
MLQFNPCAPSLILCDGKTKGIVQEFRGSSMCVAVPAEVLEIKEGNIGLVDYGDLRQEIRLDLVDVKVGEFVLVHVGFAIQRLSREEGLETREVFRQVYAAMEE